MKDLKTPIPVNNKVNAKHVLENQRCKIMAQILYLCGPSVDVTRSSLSKSKNLGEEPLICLIFSCALVSPNSRGIKFGWGIKVEGGGQQGSLKTALLEIGMHGVVLRLTFIVG